MMQKVIARERLWLLIRLGKSAKPVKVQGSGMKAGA